MVSAGHPQIRILVADDHPIVREGLRGLIAVQPDIVVVAEASNGREAIQQFRIHRPDVTVMDLQMPEMNGVDAVFAIRVEFPGAKIIVLTTYAGDAQVLRALKAGAQGYLLKAVLHKELRGQHPRCLCGAQGYDSGGRRPGCRAQRRRSVDTQGTRGPAAGRAGNANKVIAAQLSISEETVKSRVKNVLDKLGANDRTHAVTIGLKRGIIEL